MSTLSIDYQIRLARLHELPAVIELERAAASLFRQTAYTFIADAPLPPIELLAPACLAERIWLAVKRDLPVGFAIAAEIDGMGYLQELDVHPAHGRQGIGRALVETVCDWSRQQGYDAVFLSTYRDVEWNAPFYRKLGFQIVNAADLTAGFQQIRRREAESGHLISERVIMRREL